MCKFEIDMSVEEAEAMNWLGDVLNEIRKKGPEHRSFTKAAIATCFLNKLQDYCRETHKQLHEQEATIMRYVATKLYTQDVGHS